MAASRASGETDAPSGENLRDSPPINLDKVAFTFGGAHMRRAHFPEAPNLKVLLPERFRGGCSFGASAKQAPTSPTGFNGALNRGYRARGECQLGD